MLKFLLVDMYLSFLCETKATSKEFSLFDVEIVYIFNKPLQEVTQFFACL